MDYTREIIKKIDSLSGSKSSFQVFSDWVKCTALSIAQSMKEQGVNYQKNLRVVAQDLDWNALYMCYIQLSLLGIDAKCVQGDTLENKSFDNLSENVFLTPMYFLNGCVW